MTTGADRVGMPRFVSTLAANIDRRVEERSIEALYECHEAAPVDLLVYAALSVYLENGRQSEFLADYVLSKPEASPLARAFAASALVNAGRTEEAQKVMAEAAAAAPNDARVMRREAKLNLRLKNKDLAIEQFEKALALEPDNYETHRTYGWALYNLDEPQKAVAQFRLAQQYTGDLNTDLVAGLCLCAAAVKNTNEAKAAYRQLVSIEPDWKKAEYVASLPGWTDRERKALETLRSAAFPAGR
jgi:tetratricopeptide (TPR) repeat protein